MEEVDNPLRRIPVRWRNAISVIARECVVVVMEPFAIGKHGKDEVASGGYIRAIELVSNVVSQTIDQANSWLVSRPYRRTNGTYNVQCHIATLVTKPPQSRPIQASSNQIFPTTAGKAKPRDKARGTKYRC